jgi:hypothetical protein
MNVQKIEKTSVRLEKTSQDDICLVYSIGEKPCIAWPEVINNSLFISGDEPENDYLNDVLSSDVESIPFYDNDGVMIKPPMEKISTIKDLVDLGDEAKNNNLYVLANISFAHIADILIYMDCIEKLLTKPFLTVEYEDAGVCDSAYYDLIGVTIDDRSLCIPVPLVNVVTCYKIMGMGLKYIEKKIHNRHKNETIDSRLNYGLYDRFFNIVKGIFDTSTFSQSYVMNSINRHLNYPEKVYRELLKDYNYIRHIQTINKKFFKF